MKLAYSPIQDCSISKLSTITGRKAPANGFHVFNNDEFLNKNKELRYPFRPDHFSMLLVLSEGMQVQQSLVTYDLQANTLFVVYPNLVHQIVDVLEGTQILGIAFSRDYMNHTSLPMKHIEAFEFLSSQSSPLLVLENKEMQTLQTLLSLLSQTELSEAEHPYKNEVIHNGFSMFMFELAGIFRRNRGDRHIKMTRKEEHLIGFIKLLSQHFREERSVQYYADALFVTPKHLTKTVKELTNKTTGELIDEMVILEAKILLDNPALTVGNVAEQLHFSDQFFFSKFFKNHTGLSPTEYKSTL